MLGHAIFFGPPSTSFCLLSESTSTPLFSSVCARGVQPETCFLCPYFTPSCVTCVHIFSDFARSPIQMYIRNAVLNACLSDMAIFNPMGFVGGGGIAVPLPACALDSPRLPDTDWRQDPRRNGWTCNSTRSFQRQPCGKANMDVNERNPPKKCILPLQMCLDSNASEQSPCLHEASTIRGAGRRGSRRRG